MTISRRQVMGGIGAATLCARPCTSFGADLSESAAGPEEAVVALEERARQAHILVPSSKAAERRIEPPSFRSWKARLLEIITKADESRVAAGLASDADEQLWELTKRERGPRDAGMLEKKAVHIPVFDEVKGEYRKLFDSCTIRDNRVQDVDADKKFLLLTSSVEHYKSLSAKTGVPWYFIGLVHDLEASFRFRGHLHNGDPLGHRTVTEPKNRPPVWLPPSDWESSGKDALEYEQSVKKELWGKPDDWSLERMLHRFEMYNGFGSRAHGIHTPYLWSFSKHYTKGKYTSDGHWDANAVSDQCGAAVLLFRLVQTGAIERPPASV